MHKPQAKDKRLIDERLNDLKEWLLKFKDKEEEEKLDPAWKKLRPSGDAMKHKLPGSFGKKGK